MEWTQDDSQLYRQLSAIAVPARAEQLATLLTLIPFSEEDSFKVVELASGEGYLSAAILEAFPGAEVLALDFEESMRDTTAQRLSSYEGRFHIDEFDMLRDDWFDRLVDADVVISSLCIHHLDDAGKRQLFNAVQSRLSERGVLLIADLVLPKNGQAKELFASTWDSVAEAASIQLTMARDIFQLFVDEQWNIYRYPDDFDKPSPIYEQLTWLDKAGFESVDVFWMQAGHAIYGGYKQSGNAGLKFENCLSIAHKILKN